MNEFVYDTLIVPVTRIEKLNLSPSPFEQPYKNTFLSARNMELCRIWQAVCGTYTGNFRRWRLRLYGKTLRQTPLLPGDPEDGRRCHHMGFYGRIQKQEKGTDPVLYYYFANLRDPKYLEKEERDKKTKHMIECLDFFAEREGNQFVLADCIPTLEETAGYLQCSGRKRI